MNRNRNIASFIISSVVVAMYATFTFGFGYYLGGGGNHELTALPYVVIVTGIVSLIACPFTVIQIRRASE